MPSIMCCMVIDVHMEHFIRTILYIYVYSPLYSSMDVSRPANNLQCKQIFCPDSVASWPGQSHQIFHPNAYEWYRKACACVCVPLLAGKMSVARKSEIFSGRQIIAACKNCKLLACFMLLSHANLPAITNQIFVDSSSLAPFGPCSPNLRDHFSHDKLLAHGHPICVTQSIDQRFSLCNRRP